jgi:O-antigen ligase
MQLRNTATSVETRLPFPWQDLNRLFSSRLFQAGFVILMGVGFGLAALLAGENYKILKLLVGLFGGVGYVVVTMRWPEYGILGLVALLSGLISTSWLPVLRMGPASLNISDIMLLVLLGAVFLRFTTQKGFKLIGSPLMLPLFLFIGAFLLSAANAIFIQGVNLNIVLRTVRVLILWIVFFPTLQLIRDEQALRRFLTGLVILSGILLLGVLFPNKFEPLLYIEVRPAGTGTEMYSGVTRLYYAGDMVLYAMIPVTVAALGVFKKGNQLWRLGLLGLLLFWAYRTFFRQYWLTLFVVCVLLLVFLTSRERFRLLKHMMPAIVMGALLLVALMAFQPERIERITYIFSDRIGSLLEDPFKKEGSLQWRVIETNYALQQISRHPVFGIGLANSYRPPMAGESSSMYSGWAYKYIENGYLYIALMMGLMGLLPFLWLSALYLIRVFLYQREIQEDGLRAFYLGFGAAFLGMAACNLASPTFVIGTRLVFFPVTMAISEIILRLEREKKVHR